MTTLPTVELGVLGPLQVRQYGLPVAIPGAKPRAVLTMLGLHGGSVVSADTLVELLWGADPPRTAAKALQTHISSLRRALGDGFVLTEGAGWTLSTTEIDATRYTLAGKMGRDAVAAGDASQAVARFDEALTIWRGIPELPDGTRGVSERTRWIEGHAAVVEDRADALLATGRAAEIIGDLEAAIADAPLRERRWGQLMLALYRAGRQGEALGAYQRARSLLANELGVDPGPDLRRLEAAIVAQDTALEMPVSERLSVVTRAVTFLLTDIEGSTAAWEADADAMAVALARHDELVEQIVTSRGGRLIKTRGEGDATFSVFDRPSAAAAAAIELQEAIFHEPWAPAEPMRIRMALHTGEVELRDGDYFGRAVNRAARLRSLSAGGQILCSGATAELVIDTLPDDVVLADLGMRQLKNLPRPEHVFELRLENADDFRAPATEVPIERPALSAVLAGPGPFVGRRPELERLLSAWQTTLSDGTRAVLIAGEPGVGKTRLAGEWSRNAYEQGAVVLYGRCDEDLGAPYQPFAESLRSLVPCLGAKRLRALRGVEALLPLVPGLADALPDLAAPTRSDPDTERYALFDAVVALLGVASASAPVVLILDDLHWAAKPTLLLLRHLLRFGEQARVQIVGTYRSTDLDRSHPLAAMLADLHRDGSASRLALSGLDEGDVTAYVAEAGYDDEELARALATVTGGNPFFLIEALRHVDESGGRWDPSTLPQGVREAVSRRLSRLPAETNKALAAAAVVGSHFALALVESVVGEDLIDAFDEASKAGIVIEEPGGRYRFNHAIVRQSLLAELASVRRMRLHQKIAATLETEPGADDELLADLAHHYFECAWAGNAAKAVDYCRRAADQAMARLAYEGAADLYDRAVHALEEVDEELPDRDDQQAELLVARCEALLAAGDVVSAAGAVSQLQAAAGDSGRLAAWGTCFDGQLSMLTDPERLDEIESAVGAAAEKLAGSDDAAGEAKAHTVRAGCLARLGRIGDAETALDQALTAARRAGEHRRVNAVLANAPLAALWGPNPVPRAGGRCLDVVRLLRITTGSPVVEATSTRCQGVLDALRGRAAAGRALIDSARRTLTDLGMRHALLEVDQFAGIVEMVADDPASAEPHLRRAYNGFRRMGLDADTAETAALLARACLALDRHVEADELCTESERLAGHALKPSIAWRTVRAQLLALDNSHDEARRVAEEAVALAERTDALVDHGDACLALATVLGIAGDTARARAAAERAVELYEMKGATALAEKARKLLGDSDIPAAQALPEPPIEEMDNACVQALRRLDAAFDREAWGELEEQVAPTVTIESRRKVVGLTREDLPSGEWARGARSYREVKAVRHRHLVVAVRGERLALTRLEIGTADVSPGAPRDELLQLFGLDDDGRVALQVFFDIEDMDGAIAELEATHARFEEVHPRARKLENAASNAGERFLAYFATRDWDAMAEMLADGYSSDDRRRVVNAGIQQGRDAEILNMQAIEDLWITNVSTNVIATRGARLTLMRARYSGRDQAPEAFLTEILGVIEINTDDRITSLVVFDPDNMDAAFEELDARYLAGEAAPYARVWQSAMDALGEANRHGPGPNLRGLTYVDHRRVSFGSADFGRAVEELWALVPDARYRVTAVHALDAHGTVASLVIDGTDSHGNKLEWSRVVSLVPDEPQMDVYEDDDVDAAVARLEELRPQQRRLENAATKVEERFQAHFAARDWAAMGEILADDISADDRRRVVNAGIRHGRDAKIADMRATADLGTKNGTSTVIAIRGQRLALVRIRLSGRDERPDAFHTAMLGIAEINADHRMAARVLFDVDDIDAAFEELDGRYLAGEAAAHAHTWSVIARTYAEFNRHDYDPSSVVNVDHRRVARFAPGDLTAANTKGLTPNLRAYVEAVHRLSDLGAVVTCTSYGTSQEGFEAEWRTVLLQTVDGDLMNRNEMFDGADLDAALAKFDELSRPTPRLENAASRMYNRFNAYLKARDWDAMAELIADDVCSDDRRRVVSGGVQRGRDAQTANLRAVVDVGVKNFESVVIATRGERVALARTRVSGGGQQPEAFGLELLTIIEIDSDNRISAGIQFDIEDIDAAFDELDARYVAGEAAEHSHTWSVIDRAIAAFNRHELPEFMPEWVNIDHRRARWFAPGDLTAYIRATWDLAPDVNVYIAGLHQLSNLGAVFSQVTSGSSQDGFDAEWREIVLATVEGDLINRIEIFDEADLGAALARFDELSRPAPRLENAASQVYERFWASFAASDWVAMAEILAVDTTFDDRRRVVNAGIRRGRDAGIADMRAIAELWAENMTTTVSATRGSRVALSRVRSSATQTELLNIVEINADEQIVALIAFDPNDIDATFEELDARYLAGEAASHAHTWALIAGAIAGVNRHELPELAPDWVNIDHRQAIAFAPGDMTAYVLSTWDDGPDGRAYIEAVHRLSNLGAIVTQVGHEISPQGFEAEWRMLNLLTVEGDRFNRCELFDEADIDAALARFDELARPAPRLENAASQTYERYLARLTTRDWAAISVMLADDHYSDDRRRVIGAGIRHGRDAEIEDLRSATADLATMNTKVVAIATRGERLALCHARYSGRDQRAGAFHVDVLHMVELDAHERIVAHVVFDPDNIEAAFAELDARYLAGEAADHAHTWSLIVRNYAAFNRHEFPSAAPDWVTIDHRRGTSFAPGDLMAYIRSAWEVAPDTSAYIETVHRVSDRGAIFTQVSKGMAQKGFEVQWREICLLTVDGELFGGCELFDESDFDAALARFDELTRPAPRLENTAIRARARGADAYNRRDMEGFLALAGGRYADRRKGLRDEGAADRNFAHAVLSETPTSWRLEIEPVAVRGNRLALSREAFRDTDEVNQPITVELIVLTEVADAELVSYTVFFDPDDIDAAFAELDTRYLAGDAAAYASTWSVLVQGYAAANRHELAATPPDFVNIDHRPLALIASGDLIAYLRSTFDLTPDISTYMEAVHRLTARGAVFTHVGKGTSQEGFDAEWRLINVVVVDGDQMSRCEFFDEADLDAALARFDELSRPAPQLENSATRAWARIADAYNRRDLDGFLAQTTAEGRLEDRRKLLRASHAGLERRKAAEAWLRAPESWRMEIEPIAIRGHRLGLTRERSRDTAEPDQPIVVETLTLTETNDSELVCYTVLFDPDDINGAMAELTARWIATGEVAHPEVIDSVRRLNETANRHDWDAIATRLAGATYVSHRQLGLDGADIEDYLSSIRMFESLVPDLWTEPAEVLAHSAVGLVAYMVLKGTSIEGVQIEIPNIHLALLDGDRVTHLETFDPVQRDLALARFQELNTSS